MTDPPDRKRFPPERVAIGLAGFDDIAVVRYIHAACFRLLAGQYLDEEHIAAFADRVMSPEYTDRLADRVRHRSLVSARIDSEMVATAGWTSRPGGARLESLFVRPMLGGLGIGSLLLAHIEKQVLKAGAEELAITSPLEATSFFEQRGYQVVSSGATAPTGAMQIPVTFMRKTLTLATASEPEASGSMH